MGCQTDQIYGIFFYIFSRKDILQSGSKARFIANSSSCLTTEISYLLTSCLTAVNNMLSSTVKKYMRDLV